MDTHKAHAWTHTKHMHGHTHKAHAPAITPSTFPVSLQAYTFTQLLVVLLQWVTDDVTNIHAHIYLLLRRVMDGVTHTYTLIFVLLQ